MRPTAAIPIEVRHVLRGVPHGHRHTDTEIGRVLFLYAPARADEFSRNGWGPAVSISGAEVNEIYRSRASQLGDRR